MTRITDAILILLGHDSACINCHSPFIHTINILVWSRILRALPAFHPARWNCLCCFCQTLYSCSGKLVEWIVPFSSLPSHTSSFNVTVEADVGEVYYRRRSIVATTLKTFVVKCLYWNEDFHDWTHDGGKVCFPWTITKILSKRFNIIFITTDASFVATMMEKMNPPSFKDSLALTAHVSTHQCIYPSAK